MSSNKSYSENIEQILKTKKILFAIDGVEGGRRACDTSLYGAFKNIFGKVVLFNPRKYIFDFGRKETTQLFLNTIETEHPDFFFFFPARDSTGFLTLETVRKITHQSPMTKTVALFGDDDRDFEFFSRYIVLFVDYALVAQHNFLELYGKEGFGSKVFPIHVADSGLFKPLVVEKKHDVVFIGKPNVDRIKLLRVLIKNKINVKIYGYNWSDYAEFKDFYCGVARNEDIIRIINESRINLSFSRSDAGVLHYTGRVFEVAECMAFQLVEFFDGYLNFFRNNDEIVMFRNEKDLIKKINYYLV
ncbi:glycosyltransferase, partial [Candidatus Woesearchaeota archaeon]|nr:glycosyltransferase [Candidatus Woesearchaeota archaeon]